MLHTFDRVLPDFPGLRKGANEIRLIPGIGIPEGYIDLFDRRKDASADGMCSLSQSGQKQGGECSKICVEAEALA